MRYRWPRWADGFLVCDHAPNPARRARARVPSEICRLRRAGKYPQNPISHCQREARFGYFVGRKPDDVSLGGTQPASERTFTAGRNGCRSAHQSNALYAPASAYEFINPTIHLRRIHCEQPALVSHSEGGR
jgi:hypothetical protein